MDLLLICLKWSYDGSALLEALNKYGESSRVLRQLRRSPPGIKILAHKNREEARVASSIQIIEVCPVEFS